MSEKIIMQEIQLELAKVGVRLFRNNVGFLQDKTGKYVHFGFCTGSSDLIGWTPRNGFAVFTAIEVKTPVGRMTVEQKAFIEAVNKSGGIAFMARSSQEALEKIRGYIC